MRGDIFRLCRLLLQSTVVSRGKGKGGPDVPERSLSRDIWPADYRLLQAGICCAVYIQISDFLKKYLQKG